MTLTSLTHELPAVLSSLGTAVVHSLWQITVLGLLLAAASRLVQSAALRHSIGMLCLVAAIAWPAATFFADYDLAAASPQHAVQPMDSSPAVPGSDLSTALGVASSSGPARLQAGHLSRNLRFAFGLLWLVGTSWMLARLSLGLGYLRSIRRRSKLDRQLTTTTDRLQQRLQQLGQRVGLSPRLLQRIELSVIHQQLGPCTYGLLRAIILLPLSAVAGLSPSQLDAIVLHELAHIQRRDAWFATLQAILDCALFYHPIARWMSRTTASAREEACDEMVVAHCPDRTDYAQALLGLVKLRRVAPAAAAHGSHLQRRVRRILGLGQPVISPFRSAWVALALPMAVLLTAAAAALATQPKEENSSPGEGREAKGILLRAEVVTLGRAIEDEGLEWTVSDREQHLEHVLVVDAATSFAVRRHVQRALASPSISTHSKESSNVHMSFYTQGTSDTRSDSGELQSGEIDLSFHPSLSTNDLVVSDLDLSVRANGTDEEDSEPLFGFHLSDWVLQADVPLFLMETASRSQGRPPIGVIVSIDIQGDSEPIDPATTKPITLSVKDADLLEVIETFARYGEMELVIAPSAEPLLSAPVTVQAIQVPLLQMLEAILKMNCLEGSYGDGKMVLTGEPGCRS